MPQYVWETPLWPDLRWDSGRLLSRLGAARLAQGRLLSQAAGLGLPENAEARGRVLVEEAMETSCIEGELLDPASVRSSVARRLGLPGVGLPPEDRHVAGLVDVLLDAATEYEEPLTPERLKAWHAALFPTGFSGLRRIRTGEWRTPGPMRVVSGPLGRETVHFEAPPAERVEREIGEFLTWLDSTSDPIDGLLKAGIAHFRFVTIHPFEDGNGRLARATTDLVLARDERMPSRFYSMSSQIMAERETYYAVLERSQRGEGDITAWLDWFLGCFERAVNGSQTLLDGVLTKARFWQKNAQVRINERQRKVVNRMLDAGPAGFQGGLTSRKYVGMTRASRATAHREITDLVSKGLLRSGPARGRSTFYELVPSEAVGKKEIRSTS
jgi:Fic family protein